MQLTAFTETQKFNSLPLILILGVVSIVLIRVFFAVIANKEHKNIRWFLFPLFLIPLAVLVLTFIMRLDTRVDATGIYYRFYPVHSKVHAITWQDVDSAYVRKYSP